MGLTRTACARNLPSPGYYSSNHVLVNRERVFKGLKPLQRCNRLDELAREHACKMATYQQVMPSVRTAQELQIKLHCSRVGENTLRGASIREIHAEMMKCAQQPACRANVLAPRFTRFGMGTALGQDGKLYLVQLFSGDEDLMVVNDKMIILDGPTMDV